MSKSLILIGACLILIGFAWPWLKKMGVGHLPGDISIKSDNYSFYFPIVSCLLISLILSGLMWLWNRFF